MNKENGTVALLDTPRLLRLSKNFVQMSGRKRGINMEIGIDEMDGNIVGVNFQDLLSRRPYAPFMSLIYDDFIFNCPIKALMKFRKWSWSSTRRSHWSFMAIDTEHYQGLH